MQERTSLTRIAHRVMSRWELTRKAKELRDLYEAILYVGSMRFGIHNCVGAQLVKERHKLQGLELSEVTEAPIYYYTPPKRDEYFAIHLDNPCKTVELDDFVEDFNADYSFVQFIGVSDDTRREVVKHIPNVPNLAGQGTPEI